MHTIFKDEYWEQQCIRDESDYLARRLLSLSKKYSIPLKELQKLFPDIFNTSELKGCGIILYTNVVKRDKFRMRVIFDEKSHGSKVTVDVLVTELYKKGNSLERMAILDIEEEFSGENSKSLAAKFCEEWVSKIEEEYLKD